MSQIYYSSFERSLILFFYVYVRFTKKNMIWCVSVNLHAECGTEFFYFFEASFSRKLYLKTRQITRKIC